MPCYQSSGLPSGVATAGRTAYATEAACLEACKEGACCEGATCSVRPQCQCQGAGKTFRGIGTTCEPFVLPASASLTASLEYTQLDPPPVAEVDCSSQGSAAAIRFCEGTLSGKLTFGMSRNVGGGNSFSGMNIAQEGTTGNVFSASAVLTGNCAGGLSISIGTSLDIPFTSPSAYNLGAAGSMSGGYFESTYYLYNLNYASDYTTLITTSSTFPADGSFTTYDPQRIPQTIEVQYIWRSQTLGTLWYRDRGTWRVVVKATLTT